MVSVEFNLKKKGTCQWCRKERDEIYDVTFGDKTFVGMLCKADLFRAIDMKLPVEKTEAKGTAPAHDPKMVTHTNGSGFGGPGISTTEGSRSPAAIHNDSRRPPEPQATTAAPK